MIQEKAEYFKTRKEAHDWMKAEGYQISIGKFYTDIKNNGFPVVNADKSVSKYQVMEYARALTEETRPDISALERSEHLHRKEAAEAAIAEMKAEKMRREEDRLWLHSDNAWSALAAVVGNLRDVIRRGIHAEQVPIVQAAGGELHRAPEVYEYIDGVVNTAFNEVTRAAIDIQWEKET